ncbi:uncharacterized protein FSUBG_6474 [Fusarium subglutinans]|uniref:Uncharacterized protein n=1 Tax=Gibberella subglutinans TaxID=42677 RepID=A0A8H5V129_GIBSU|nr:uncharacterized protein FSUBG_6474 [Fusarium subglutinans]KAF5605553.1 hypothetical protein FSUBG_6474 [Fusarium subglutinans]
MQGSASYPAALGSSKWIASFLARNRYDDGIYVRTSTRASSPQEVKFRDFVKKSKAELRNVFSANEKKRSEAGVDGMELNTLFTYLPQLTFALPELRNANEASPERKNNKLSWGKLFDTKSGNKLHKRAKSAPSNNHVPHQLDPITEAGESSETQANLVSANTSSRRPVGESPLCSGALQTNGDDVSVMTTCTTIIQQANLEGVSEGNAHDATTNDECIVIGGRNCTSNPSTHLSSGNSSTTEDECPSRSESDNTSDCYGATMARYELLKSQREYFEKNVRPEENAQQKETARQEDNVLQTENPGQEHTNNNDLTSKSSSKYSLRSVLSMLMGSDKSDEEPKPNGDGIRKLNHKSRLPPRWRTFLVWTSKSESSAKSNPQSSSQNISQSDAQLANQIAEQDRTFKGLDWKLPAAKNEMGQLIREFSGDLNTTTQEMGCRAPVSPRTPSLHSYPSKFDVSMDQNLPPRPAMTPVPYPDNQDHNQQMRDESTSRDALVAKQVHMENKQAQLVEIETRSNQTMNQDARGNAKQNQVPQETVERDTTNDVHPPRTWQHGGDPTEVETVEEAYARHRSSLAVVDRIRSIGLLGPNAYGTESIAADEPKELDEQRLLREMTEDFELPPNRVVSNESSTAATNNSQVIPSIEHQDTNLGCEGQKTPEPNAEQNDDASNQTELILTRARSSDRFYYAATDDMGSDVRGFEGDEEEIPEDFTPGQPATEALIKELRIERLGGFFTTLENVRSESPERLIAARDPKAVFTWRDEIAELTSNGGGMIRDGRAEQLYEQALSTKGSDGELSAMAYKPSRAEVEAALGHPEAPVIQGCQPQEFFTECERIKESIHIDSLAKDKYIAQMQPAMSRNEIIFAEWDRADAVACMHKHNQQQRLKEQEQESEEAARRRRLKIYRAVERNIIEGRRLAVKINREATAAFQMCEYLDEDYERMREQILQCAEECGHEPTDNLQHAVELIRKTQQEEQITYRKYEGFESADVESPESEMAARYGRDYQDIAGNHVDMTVDPTNEFF